MNYVRKTRRVSHQKHFDGCRKSDPDAKALNDKHVHSHTYIHTATPKAFSVVD